MNQNETTTKGEIKVKDKYLKKAVEEVAKERGIEPLEVITVMQTACVVDGGRESTLDDLCELKWDYI